MGHGTQDPVVRLAWAESSRDALRRAGWKVEWRAYPMEHSAVVEELVEVGRFITRALEPVSA